MAQGWINGAAKRDETILCQRSIRYYYSIRIVKFETRIPLISYMSSYYQRGEKFGGGEGRGEGGKKEGNYTFMGKHKADTSGKKRKTVKKRNHRRQGVKKA